MTAVEPAEPGTQEQQCDGSGGYVEDTSGDGIVRQTWRNCCAHPRTDGQQRQHVGRAG
ncbi:hypothetical protein [Streptomyces qinglanensis]|uniref:Uncharacterized protein n=1 Tax=Streptomyces qinglanensis TaxID=943816 RepID=A0A1H9U2U8_9ACTN|nr:hypothetical protein [Streptomyces qinglanensis]SES03835.1 hypothetical protein SAMN05421870_107277 [Streptomyces qinglanensis]